MTMHKIKRQILRAGSTIVETVVFVPDMVVKKRLFNVNKLGKVDSFSLFADYLGGTSKE